nr:unnamed protein product [Leishmania braziliensis]
MAWGFLPLGCGVPVVLPAPAPPQPIQPATGGSACTGRSPFAAVGDGCRFASWCVRDSAPSIAGDTGSHPLSRRAAGPIAPRSPRCRGDGASAAVVVAGGHGNAPQACGSETPLPRRALACAEDPPRNRARQHRTAPPSPIEMPLHAAQARSRITPNIAATQRWPRAAH